MSVIDNGTFCVGRQSWRDDIKLLHTSKSAKTVSLKPNSLVVLRTLN